MPVGFSCHSVDRQRQHSFLICWGREGEVVESGGVFSQWAQAEELHPTFPATLPRLPSKLGRPWGHHPHSSERCTTHIYVQTEAVKWGEGWPWARGPPAPHLPLGAGLSPVTLSLCHQPRPFLSSESSVLGSHCNSELMSIFCKVGTKVYLPSVKGGLSPGSGEMMAERAFKHSA